MNRRNFFVKTMGIVGAGMAVRPEDARYHANNVYGFVDVDRWQHLARAGVPLRTFVNGKDITSDCRWADDIAGIAEVLVRTPEGNAQFDPRDPSKVWVEHLRGHVIFLPGKESK